MIGGEPGDTFQVRAKVVYGNFISKELPLKPCIIEMDIHDSVGAIKFYINDSMGNLKVKSS